MGGGALSRGSRKVGLVSNVISGQEKEERKNQKVCTV